MKALYNNQQVNIIGLKTTKIDGIVMMFYLIETQDRTKKLIISEHDKHFIRL